MINPASNWLDIVELAVGKLPNKDLCKSIFDDTWLVHYPKPMEVGFTNGHKFKSQFRELCVNMDRKIENGNINMITEEKQYTLKMGNIHAVNEVKKENNLWKRKQHPVQASETVHCSGTQYI